MWLYIMYTVQWLICTKVRTGNIHVAIYNVYSSVANVPRLGLGIYMWLYIIYTVQWLMYQG